ncbi:hypothetical protein [Hydrogenophaga atypica]|uniref:Uncharacterized protein n=1 Tax=Hydrogenophaga atypica TaxID=249409 RepID=A0ABW2QGU8_9BURK
MAAMNNDKCGPTCNPFWSGIPTGNQVSCTAVCRHDTGKSSHAGSLLVAINAPTMLDARGLLLHDWWLKPLNINNVIVGVCPSLQESKKGECEPESELNVAIHRLAHGQ